MEQGAVPDMSRAGRQRRPTVQGRAGDVRLNRTANQVEWNRLPTLRFPVRLPTESLRADGARCASSERPDAPDRDQQAKAQSAAQQHIGFHFVPLKTWQRRRRYQRTRSKAGRISSALSIGAGRSDTPVREYYALQLSERMRDRWLDCVHARAGGRRSAVPKCARLPDHPRRCDEHELQSDHPGRYLVPQRANQPHAGTRRQFNIIQVD